MTPTTIVCSGLTRRFVSPGLDPVVAVGAVDLTVGPGEFVAIEGPRVPARRRSSDCSPGSRSRTAVPPRSSGTTSRA